MDEDKIIEDPEAKVRKEELESKIRDYSLNFLDTNSRAKVDSEEYQQAIRYFNEDNAPHRFFEKISKYADEDIPYPIRKTPFSAGYDMVAAEDVIIPPYAEHLSVLQGMKGEGDRNKALTIKDVATLTKASGAKPTLIPTGYKCYLHPNEYLQLSIRSSSPLKYWLVLANGVGIIDADQVNNSDNEGHIYFQVINLSPFPIYIKKGDAIGQAIVVPYNNLDLDLIKSVPRAGGFGSTNEAPST